MLTPDMQRAARRDPDGSRKKFDHDHIWQKIRVECSRADAAEQITSSPPLEHPLPCVRAALMRDRCARLALGLPLIDHSAIRRQAYAAAVTADEFRAARRRGRRR